MFVCSLVKLQSKSKGKSSKSAVANNSPPSLQFSLDSTHGELGDRPAGFHRLEDLTCSNLSHLVKNKERVANQTECWTLSSELLLTQTAPLAGCGKLSPERSLPGVVVKW